MPNRSFDRMSWAEIRDVQGVASEGGRQVLGWALAILALLWTGYTAWSAGRVAGRPAADQPGDCAMGRDPGRAAGADGAGVADVRPNPAQGGGAIHPLGHRDAHRGARRCRTSSPRCRTRSSENHRTLGVMAGDLMGLGDQAATRLGAITADLNRGSQTLAEHGAALDRAAEAARTDIGVLLTDLPQAEESARRMAETLREAGRSAIEQAEGFETQVGQLVRPGAAGRRDRPRSIGAAARQPGTDRKCRRRRRAARVPRRGDETERDRRRACLPVRPKR